MDELVAALLVPIVMGVVEMVKRAGLSKKLCAPLAVLMGVVGMIGVNVAELLGQRQIYVAVLQGMGVGLSAAGLFSVTRSAAAGAELVAETVNPISADDVPPGPPMLPPKG